MIVILAVRTYAVWKKDKRVGIGLALLLGLYQIPDGIILHRFIEGFDCECPRFVYVHISGSTLPFRHAEPISRTPRGVCLHQGHEARLRELANVCHCGGRYAKHSKDSLIDAESHSCPCFDGHQGGEGLSAPPQRVFTADDC